MRKRIGFSTVCMLLGVVAFLYADTLIKKFSLEPGYNKVTVRWDVDNETGVKGYEVQRGLTETDFSKLTFIDAKTPAQPTQSYEYEDKTVFKTTVASRTFYYRLKIVDADGSFNYSKVESVTPTVSSARQTWGSIKAMFR